MPQSTSKTGHEIQGLVEKIKGKEGRFRSNLSGKRTNFSARSTIIPDTNLNLDEVGVPESLAITLTKKQYVN